MRMRPAANGVRQHHCPACAKVVVLNVHRALIERREVVDQGKVRSLRQLNESVAEILRIGTRVERAVAGHAEDGAIGRGGKAGSAHPEPAEIPIWRGIVYTNLLKRLRIVTGDPTVIGRVITIRTPDDVDDTT